jgi:hypothetical protein
VVVSRDGSDYCLSAPNGIFAQPCSYGLKYLNIPEHLRMVLPQQGRGITRAAADDTRSIFE